MQDYAHKGWPLTMLGTIGTITTWALHDGLAIIIGIATLFSLAFAIRASIASKRNSEEQTRLAREQLEQLLKHRLLNK